MNVAPANARQSFEEERQILALLGQLQSLQVGSQALARLTAPALDFSQEHLCPGACFPVCLGGPSALQALDGYLLGLLDLFSAQVVAGEGQEREEVLAGDFGLISTFASCGDLTDELGAFLEKIKGIGQLAGLMVSLSHSPVEGRQMDPVRQHLLSCGKEG